MSLSSAPGRWLLAASVLGSSVTMLTGTVVNVALPAIGTALEAGAAGLQWVLNGYLLAVASLILIGGSLGDRFGQRRVFVVGSAGFVLASLVCGLAPTIEVLVAGRVAQGVAAALLTPGSLAVIESTFREEDRGRAIGAWSALGGIAAAVGPLLGGWLVDVGSWRWVFFLNIPLSAAAIALALRWVPGRAELVTERLDWGGAALVFLALGGLTWALIQAPERGLAHAGVWAPGAGGIVLLVGFLSLERRLRSPMLPLDLFRNRQFSAANGVTFVIYAALGGVFFLLMVHLQVALGYGALAAGGALLPVTILMLVLSSPAGGYAQRHGARWPLTVGGALLAAGMLLMAGIQPGDSYPTAVLPAAIVFGLGLSCTVAPVTSAALAAVPSYRSGLASGVNNAVARTAQLGAVAVVPWAAGLTGGRIQDAAALTEGFPVAMRLLAGVAVGGSLVAWATLAAGPLRRPGAAEAAPAAAPGQSGYVHCAVEAPPQRVRPR